MREEKEIRVNTKLIDGKTDAELIEICKRYLGEVISGIKTGYASHFDSATYNTMPKNNLAERIAQLEDKDYPMMYLDENGMEQIVRDPKFDGRYGDGNHLQELVIRAIRSELYEVSSKSLIRNFNEKELPKEEIERRISLMADFDSKEAFRRYVTNSIPKWYYEDSLETLKKNFSGNELYNRIQKDLPTFFTVVDILRNKGMDLSTIKFSYELSLEDVYQIVNEKFSDYIRDGKVVNPEEMVQEEQKSIPQEEVVETPKESISTQYPEPKSIEDVDKTINQRKQDLEEKKQLLAIYDAKLNELNQLEAEIADIERQLAEKKQQLKEKGVSL